MDAREVSGYSPLQMRFRAKFGARGYITVSLALFALALLIVGVRSEFPRDIAIVMALMSTQTVFNQLFTYWEADSTGFRERRFWNKKEVPWQAVIRVGSLFPNQPSSDYLAIDCDDPAPMSARGRIVARREDRVEFLAALHRFAPQAKFDV